MPFTKLLQVVSFVRGKGGQLKIKSALFEPADVQRLWLAVEILLLILIVFLKKELNVVDVLSTLYISESRF